VTFIECNLIDISCISDWGYDLRDYQDVKSSLTVQRLKALRPKLWRGPIERFELPDLHGLNSVFHDALEGGVNASLNLDFHGNSLLGVTVEVEKHSN
jgi:hypothetical protein